MRLVAARFLIDLREFEIAETLLLPMVGTAHEGPLTTTARELLTKVRGRASDEPAPAP